MMGVQLPNGIKLNQRYEIRGVIGQGGFGITYEGYNEMLQRKIAVKELFIREFMERSSDTDYNVCLVDEKYQAVFEKCKNSFLKEAQVLGKYSMEAAVADVYDYFEENNTAYIVMEYLEGTTLEDFLQKEHALSASEVFLWFLPIMKTLEKIHGDKVIHRDISPDNLRVLPDQTLVLIDFGAARSFEKSGMMSRIVKDGYAPAEQYADEGKQGPWTDVYALFATIYRCITGIVPDSSVARLLYDELKKPSELGIVIDETLEQVLMQGLAVSAELRYHSFSEVLHALSFLEKNSAQKNSDHNSSTAEDSTHTELLDDEKKKPAAMGKSMLLILFLLIAAGGVYGGYTAYQKIADQKSEKYDPDVMYKVMLSAPDTMTANTFQKAIESLRVKLKDAYKEEAYRLEVDGAKAVLYLNKSAITEQNINDVMREYLTDDSLEEYLIFQIDAPVLWESAKEAAGLYQVAAEEMETGHTVQLCYSAQKELSAGALLDEKTALLTRLDALKQPYAIGTVSSEYTGGKTDSIVVWTGLQHMSRQVQELLGRSTKGLTLMTTKGQLNVGEFSSQAKCSVQQKDENYYFVIDQLSGKEQQQLHAITQEATETDPIPLYLSAGYMAGEPLLYLTADTPLSESFVSFGSAYYRECQTISAENSWLLDLLLVIAQGNTMPESLNLDTVQGYLDGVQTAELTESDYGLYSLGTDQAEELQKQIKQIDPDATTAVTGDEITIFLHLDVNDTLPQQALRNVYEIYSGIDFENTCYHTLSYIVIDETADEEARILLHRNPNLQSGLYEIAPEWSFCNGRVEAYKQKMNEVLSDGLFFLPNKGNETQALQDFKNLEGLQQ